MISEVMRVLLIVGALATLVFMLGRIRSAKVQIKDTIFWILLSVMLLVLSIAPGIALWAATLLGIESPINVIFLSIIFVLLIKSFSDSLKISRLDARQQQLAQSIALDEKRNESDTEEHSG